MNKKSRLKFAMIAFFTLIVVAILKNWFPGISETVLLMATGTPLTFIIGDTIRKSDTKGA